MRKILLGLLSVAGFIVTILLLDPILRAIDAVFTTVFGLAMVAVLATCIVGGIIGGLLGLFGKKK